MKTQALKGMRDLLPAEQTLRDYIQGKILETYRSAGFERISTPMLEDMENLDKSDGGDNLNLIFKVLKRGDKLTAALPNYDHIWSGELDGTLSVYIGGGVLGLEAASSLAEAGLSVTVLEHGDQLMKRQIDAQAAQHLESAMAGKGVKLLKNADSARIDASGVTLVDGTRVPAELVIVSAGVRANIRLAKDAGIAAERHITVDDHMRTNLPDVYAAGDCASMGVSYALWTEAADMGRIAGINAAGGDAAYQALPRPLIFHGFGTALFAFGDAGRQANIAYEIGEMPGARYYSAGGKLVGAVLTGDIRRMEEVTNLILQA